MIQCFLENLRRKFDLIRKQRLNKIVSLLIVMVMCWITSSIKIKDIMDEITAYATSDYIIGDINNDGYINSFDVVLLRKAIVNSDLSLKIESADLNGDNIIDSRDLRELEQFVLGNRNNFSISAIKDIKNRDIAIVTSDEPIETSLTAEMAEKAKELGSVQSVYNYLYNNMRSEFYYGSRKGAIGAFEQGGGNDTDLSSLLIAMLRYLGYDADYVTSEVGFTEKQLLKLTNTDSIDIAKSIMSNFRKCTIKTIDNKKYYLYNYKYVQVIDSGKTYYLDIYFKKYINQSTMYDDIDSAYTLTESNIDSIIDNFDLTLLNNEMEKCSGSVDKLVNNKYALRSDKIVSKNITKLSDNLPYYSTNAVVSDSLTDNESDTISIGFNASKQEILRVADIYKKNITISYEVSSDSKELAEWVDIDTSSIFNLPSKAMGQSFSVIPTLKVDGQKILSGSSLKIGSTQTLYISTTSGGVKRDYTEKLSAGEMCSIVFDTGQISANELAAAYTDSLKNTETINQKNNYTCDMELNESLNSKLNEKNVYSTDYLGSLLRLTGIMYFSQLDISSQALAERNNIHTENHVRFGIFGFKPSVYTGSVSADDKDGIQKEGNYFVDILSNDAKSISKNDDAIKLQSFNFNRGLISSELESSVLKEVFNVESFSTTTIFRHAQENNIPIVTISSDSETKISDLKISSNDKNNIQAELDAGRTVITTQSSVNLGSWSGIGYITMSPDGSYQEYMLSGNYKGGFTFELTGLLYAFNITFDLALLSESITLLMGMLSAMSVLSLGTVVPVLLAVVSIEFLVFDILNQSLSYYEYEFKDDMEAGMKIWTTSAINAITLATIGVGKGIGKVAESMTQAKLSAKFGETVINNIKNVGGFSVTEINSKIKQLNKLGMTQTTIDTLLKNPKFMFLSDDVLKFLSKQGENQRLLAELVINNGDDFSKALLKTTVLDDFCNLVWKYGDNATKLLIAGDNVVIRFNEIISKSNNPKGWIDLIKNNNDDVLKIQSVDIFAINTKNPNKFGQNLAELDEVDFINNIIYEDKSAGGLYIPNPNVPKTEADWAADKVLKSARDKIQAVSNNDFSIRINKNGTITQYSFMKDELKSIREYIYRIDADTPALRTAVENCLVQLRQEFPSYSFSAVYGG